MGTNLSHGLHSRPGRSVTPIGADRGTAAAAGGDAGDGAVRNGRSAERSVVHRLQGLVPNGGRDGLRSVDDDGCGEPLSASVRDRVAERRGGAAGVRSAVPGAWAALGDADGQRGPVRLPKGRRAEPAPDRLGEAWHPAGADRSGLAAAGWPARANASHAEEGGDLGAARHDSGAQQARFDTFRQSFNEERPHEALGQATAASRYAVSTPALSRSGRGSLVRC